MDMEKRFIHLIWIQLVIEVLVVFFCKVSWFTSPSRIHIIDNILLFCLYLFAIFPLFFHTKGNLHWQELTVFSQQTFYSCIFQVLCIFIIDMQHDIRTTFGLDSLFHGVFWRTIATPVHGFRILLVT